MLCPKLLRKQLKAGRTYFLHFKSKVSWVPCLGPETARAAEWWEHEVVEAAHFIAARKQQERGRQESCVLPKGMPLVTEFP